MEHNIFSPKNYVVVGPDKSRTRSIFHYCLLYIIVHVNVMVYCMAIP